MGNWSKICVDAYHALVAFYVVDNEDPFFLFPGWSLGGFSTSWHKCCKFLNVLEVFKGTVFHTV